MNQSDTAPNPIDNGTPYGSLVGELVADAMALLRAIHDQRPETRGFNGALVVSLQGRACEIVVGLEQADGRVLLIEQIAADPSKPADFGASTLQIVVPKDAVLN